LELIQAQNSLSICQPVWIAKEGANWLIPSKPGGFTHYEQRQAPNGVA